ncbi:pentapeptide repeat-containing protein [Pseudoalteromonas gelatinilytica]|uniref:Pentapeptide repeat-containing protein n=1 Tax=Pseudoalteromonas gelatinilytica TaxID=1703256 RepID=A0ABQ1TS10_9GAMM|nr:pentapeptide repeat-containing protein [Pseudoalteromonas profundi]GGF02377.1 hypothetical protein GCM10008027_29110 [Pseudoalteromonas profundi]
MLDNTIKVGSEDEIVAIFKENTEWIESKGESGQRAILDGYVLSHMNFVGDSMRGASLDRCVFDYSDCNYVDFKGAKLRNASFTKSKLACADFSSVKLNGTTFRGASLNGATLIKTKINWGDFNKAKLHKSNFQMSYIRNTDFTDANLAMTSFENANLISNNFFNANLRYANLVNTNLTRTNLSNVDLSNANITGAVLCQVLTEGWVIKNIKCDYIFADEKKEVRIPKNRLFEEGEFEELYSWFPSFVYYFKDKMHALDPYLISVIVSGLNKSNEDLHLQIDEIKGEGLYPQIEFSNRGRKMPLKWKK